MSTQTLSEEETIVITEHDDVIMCAANMCRFPEVAKWMAHCRFCTFFLPIGPDCRAREEARHNQDRGVRCTSCGTVMPNLDTLMQFLPI